jgi:hypothetical protein
MTAEQFAQWLDGFMAAVGDTPTPEQWKRIGEKLKTIRPASAPLNIPLGSGEDARKWYEKAEEVRRTVPSWPTQYPITC